MWATTSTGASCRLRSTTSARSAGRSRAAPCTTRAASATSHGDALGGGAGSRQARRRTPTSSTDSRCSTSGLHRMLSSNLQDVFSAGGLKKAHPEFDYKRRFTGGPAVNAAFAVEAMKRNLVQLRELRGRRVRHARQQLPDARAAPAGDVRPLRGARADRSTRRRTRRRQARSSRSTRTFSSSSDFCRTPQINLAHGARPLPEQLGARGLAALQDELRVRQDRPRSAPAACRRRSSRTASGHRAAGSARDVPVGVRRVDPRKYMRDGEVVRELLKA